VVVGDDMLGTQTEAPKNTTNGKDMGRAYAGGGFLHLKCCRHDTAHVARLVIKTTAQSAKQD
jgi:hypothetical protein